MRFLPPLPKKIEIQTNRVESSNLMMKSKLGLAVAFSGFFALSGVAQEVEYAPGGEKWASTWKTFYAGDYEPELPVPLMKAGPTMVPVILEAIGHPDMKMRRYAISALGHLKDESAIAPLKAIVADEGEEDWFRGDALVAIYQLNQDEGTTLAEKYKGQGDVLKLSSEWIIAKEPFLLEGGL
jgi:hypothetical protein